MSAHPEQSGATPGPWQAECRCGDWLVISSDDKNAVLYPNSVRGAKAEAFCRVAAAAPELLAAAKRALNIFKAQGESVRAGAVTGALADAIAKATGEQS